MNIEKTTTHGGPIKVGVVMDETGPLAPLGLACATPPEWWSMKSTLQVACWTDRSS